MGATAWGSGGDFGAGSVGGAGGDKGGGVGIGRRQSEDGGEGNSPVVTFGGKTQKCRRCLFTVQLTVVKVSRFGPDELHLGTPISITHLDFGADVRRAALRSLPDLRLLHCHGGRAGRSAQHGAGRSAQHGAGRQLGARLSVTLRTFGEAKWRRFSKAGFGSRHHDGWRED